MIRSGASECGAGIATLRGGVLATVVVVSVLLLLGVMGLMSLWETDFLLFSRMKYQRARQADIRSAFALYGEYPEMLDCLGADSTFLLYDSLPGSRLRISREMWGLYETVSVATADGKTCRTQLMGVECPYGQYGALVYADGGTVLTLTGNTNLHGRLSIPARGIVYGQIRSVFFQGEKVVPTQIGKSVKELPSVAGEAREMLKMLPDTLTRTTFPGLPGDSLSCGFYGNKPLRFYVGSGELAGCDFSGKIILCGDVVRLDASCRLRDLLVVARNISVGKGFEGSLQLFASDSVWLEEGTVLEYPSGVYAGKYAETGDGAEVNGYVIVDVQPGKDPKKACYRQSRTAKVRGLLWAGSFAQVQGVVSGAACLFESVYYSPQGYYRNMLYDMTLLENRQTACPLWLFGEGRRKGVKWI